MPRTTGLDGTMVRRSHGVLTVIRPSSSMPCQMARMPLGVRTTTDPGAGRTSVIGVVEVVGGGTVVLVVLVVRGRGARGRWCGGRRQLLARVGQDTARSGRARGQHARDEHAGGRTARSSSGGHRTILPSLVSCVVTISRAASFAFLPTRTLSEADSKVLLAAYGVPFAAEEVVADANGAIAAAARLGFPVVLKLNGDHIAHKTERGLVRLGLASTDAVRDAATALLAAARPEDGAVSLLVAQQVRGSRELIAGIVHDPQFGPAVMVGLGGVLAEVIGDVAFRLAPITEIDADELLDDLSAQGIFGPFRGEPAMNRAALIEVLLGLSRLAVEQPDVVSVDINPIIVCDGRPIAVDALVERRTEPSAS